MKNEFLLSLSKEELIRLIEDYSKNWLAMDGVWFRRLFEELAGDGRRVVSVGRADAWDGRGDASRCRGLAEVYRD